MGFFSAGRDQGSTFYFELPLYTAAFVGLDSEQAARAMTMSQSRLTFKQMASRDSVNSSHFFRENMTQVSASNLSVEGASERRKGPRKSIDVFCFWLIRHLYCVCGTNMR